MGRKTFHQVFLQGLHRDQLTPLLVETVSIHHLLASKGFNKLFFPSGSHSKMSYKRFLLFYFLKSDFERRFLNVVRLLLLSGDAEERMSFHTRHRLHHSNVYHQCPENVRNVRNECCFSLLERHAAIFSPLLQKLMAPFIFAAMANIRQSCGVIGRRT